MHNKTIITAAPDLDRAALVLASMSPDMVSDIVRLVNLQGASLSTTLFNPNGIAASQVANRFLGILSKEYISDEDFANVWAGLSTVFLASVRNPEMGNDHYQKVLETAFSLPSEIAEPIAKKIETYDILGPQTAEGQNADSWLNKVGRKMYEGFRKSANWAAGILGTDWEIDEQQNWDVDFLYEMKNLGEAVGDLNSRARLMRAQAAISATMGIMLTGDPSDDGEMEAALVGDTVRPFMMRSLPPSIMGNAFPIVKMGLKTAGAKASNVYHAGGVHVDKKGKVGKVHSGGHNNHIASALKSVASASPVKMGLIGAGVGLTPTIVRAVRSMIQSGDAEDGLYAVRDVYGDAVADSVKAGSMDELAKLIIADTTTDFSTGDPNLDDIAVGEMISELGDADLFDQIEEGGPIARLRANMAKRRAGRAKRRSVRQTEKTNRVTLRQKRRTKKHQNRYDETAMEAPDQDNSYEENNDISNNFDDQNDSMQYDDGGFDDADYSYE